MTAIKEIKSIKLTDEYGMTFPDAFAKIYNLSETTQLTLKGNEATGAYDEKEGTKAIAYEVIYWYDESKKAQGFRGRPLAIEDEDKSFTRVFNVDLKLPAVAAILGGTLSHNERVLRAAHEDLINRFI